MSGGIAALGEAVGDVVAGGLAARAVEPAHGEGAAHPHGRCLNCGNFLAGPYCSGCGQAGHVHRTVGAFIHDLLHGVWHFDGKLWRTLPMLFFRPGALTRRYINGERARYFSPLALFLFAVFLTFAVFSYLGAGLSSPGFDMAREAQAQSGLNMARARIGEDLARTRAAIAAARAANRPTQALDEQLREQEQAATILGLAPAADGKADRNTQFTFTDIKLGIPVLDHAIDKLNSDPALMLYKLQGNAYKYAWALIPLSAPFLWLLYPFSRRFAFYDHLVFVTYSLSFMLLLAIVLRVGAEIGIAGGLLATTFTFYPPIHMYRQLRGAYRSSRLGALVRTIILLMVAIPTLLLFMTGLLALGALG